jgi:hypothetical protein
VSDVKLTYETCVYLEQLEALIADINAVVQKHVGDISDTRVRHSMAAAALVSCAQAFDDLKPEELYRVNGASGLMRGIVTKWK